MAAPSDPVEVVGRCFEAWDRGDIEGVLAEYADDVVVETVHEGKFAGKEAARGFYREVFETTRFAHDDLELSTSGSTVLVVGRLRGAGARSGAPMDAPFAYLFRVDDGKIGRVAFYPDVEAARRTLEQARDE